MAAKIYDAKAHRTALMTNPTYFALPNFTDGVGWKEEPTGGHSLYLINENTDSADQRGYITQVGYVLPTKYFCGRGGSWQEKNGKPFSNAKYGFLLGRPDDYPLFGADWDAGIEAATAIQKSIVAEGEADHWLDKDSGGKVIRLGMRCFEKKGGDNPSGVDIAKWPVPAHLKNHLAAISNTHDVCLLPVYDVDDTLVSEPLIEKKLRGALIEVTYKLNHWFIKKENGRHIESFTGDIQQIVIKKYGKPQPRSAFHRAARPIVFAPISAIVAPKAPAADAPAPNAPNAPAPKAPASGTTATSTNDGREAGTSKVTPAKRPGDELENPITKKSIVSVRMKMGYWYMEVGSKR
ncbi:hypothetical protein R3P38DRAFT_2772963 [Favolaschia claudopus]|uniref:Uncharacterized protein n=1 Tax=Favolaschia claudopus TaxID=2862362 RepID=A0AAW0C647_9AGAR